MIDNVIKFSKAKKALARQHKDAQAAENRTKFGRTKAQKQQATLQNDLSERRLDGHMSASDRDGDKDGQS